MSKRFPSTAPPVEAAQIPLAGSIGNRIRIASKLFDKAIANRLKATGTPFGTWGFLRRLWERDGQTQMELASALDLTGSTAVTAIDRMEEMDLIRRERSDKDRRNVHIFLTKKGRALERQLLPIAIEVSDVATSGISKQDLETFRRVLQRMEESLTADQQAFGDENRRRKLLTKLRAIES